MCFRFKQQSHCIIVIAIVIIIIIISGYKILKPDAWCSLSLCERGNIWYSTRFGTLQSVMLGTQFVSTSRIQIGASTATKWTIMTIQLHALALLKLGIKSNGKTLTKSFWFLEKTIIYILHIESVIIMSSIRVSVGKKRLRFKLWSVFLVGKVLRFLRRLNKWHCALVCQHDRSRLIVAFLNKVWLNGLPVRESSMHQDDRDHNSKRPEVQQ